MASTKRTIAFYASEEAARIRTVLENMLQDAKYNTVASYTANGEEYPDHEIPFVDKHMSYLNSHPSVDTEHYLANLRLITRVR